MSRSPRLLSVQFPVVLCTLLIVSYLPVCNVHANSLADASQTSEAETKLKKLLQGFETLSAEVLQLIVESDGGVLEESDILMRLKRPDSFYWETIAPFAELIVTDGQTLWNYQPDLEQVVIEDWDTTDSELAAQLLSGETDGLNSEHTIVQLDSGQIVAETSQRFRLTPLAVDSVYDTITLNFEQGSIQSIHIASKNGQQTVWEFISVQSDPEIRDDLFRFTPPPGIEIIDNRSHALSQSTCF
ncbi:MAG: outer membrane lipoprotein chaperone LolA [Gammaproteobacteria bacterium]|nr:outer membrane lipoprotein chaperone LolA [Gammaproteobacteria bacterium]